ncbi:hypothetical protein COO60DRAFT_1543801 [Scenedesmus sp. NREL 46B-D3]|nr:hypothetical protein COO60DRAFT_1543801 [Scenedesmus sp. NREL 46B-D3]
MLRLPAALLSGYAVCLAWPHASMCLRRIRLSAKCSSSVAGPSSHKSRPRAMPKALPRLQQQAAARRAGMASTAACVACWCTSTRVCWWPYAVLLLWAEAGGSAVPQCHFN